MKVTAHTDNQCLYKFFCFNTEAKTLTITLISPGNDRGSRPPEVKVDEDPLIVTPDTAANLLKPSDIFCTRYHPNDIGLQVKRKESDNYDSDTLIISGVLKGPTILVKWFDPVLFMPGNYSFELIDNSKQDWSGWFGVGLHRD